MSRSGDRTELLKGPFCYGTVISSATVLFWRRLSAAISISALCAGDGFADIVGRRFGGKNRIPW
jgi:dolichol kinase